MTEFSMEQWFLIGALAACALGFCAWAAFAELGRRRVDGESRQLSESKEALRVEVQQTSEARARAEAERTALQQQLRERDEAARHAQEERDQLNQRIEALNAESRGLRGGQERAEAERDALRSQLRQRDEADKQAKAEREQADKQAKAEREQDRENMLGQLSERFQLLAGKALEQKREAVQGAGEQAVKRLIDPLQKDLKSFRDKIEKSYGQAGSERTELKTLVEQLHKASLNLGDEARQLTQALKGESQTRGYWGEMILEKLLEDSGLEKGRHYVSQQTFRDEDGKGKRPDVVLQLPGDRYVVIDAKVSLNAYERAVAAEGAKERDRELRAHVKSIERHIASLATKQYQELDELNGKNPDFVFMFVPLEAAYIAAYQAEPRLLQQARERKIALLSPATLLPVLLMVAEMWRVELRNRNAEKIATLAGRMYDKFSRFLDFYDKMGQRLNQVQGNWEEGKKQLSEGRGNLVVKMDQLKQLGARTTGKLPKGYEDGLKEEEEAAEARDVAVVVEESVLESAADAAEGAVADDAN